MSNEKPLTPADARRQRSEGASISPKAAELRARLNRAVSDPAHKPTDLVTVKDIPEHVIDCVTSEFRTAGWCVTAPRAVEDGDVVITIEEK